MSEAPNYVLEAFDAAVKAHAAWIAAPGLDAAAEEQAVRHRAGEEAAKADGMLHAAVDHWVVEASRSGEQG